MGEPGDTTLALHLESLSWGPILGWHDLPCHSVPPQSPHITGKAGVAQSCYQDLSNKTAFLESGIRTPGSHHHNIPNSVELCSGHQPRWPSAETRGSMGCHRSDCTTPRDPQRDMGHCLEGQVKKDAGGWNKSPRLYWPQRRAPAVLSLTPLEQSPYCTSSRWLWL